MATHDFNGDILKSHVYNSQNKKNVLIAINWQFRQTSRDCRESRNKDSREQETPLSSETTKLCSKNNTRVRRCNGDGKYGRIRERLQKLEFAQTVNVTQYRLRQRCQITDFVAVHRYSCKVFMQRTLLLISNWVLLLFFKLRKMNLEVHIYCTLC